MKGFRRQSNSICIKILMTDNCVYSSKISLRVLYLNKLEDATEQGIEIGIQALIQDNLEEGIPKEKIIEKLISRFNLDQEKALHFYDQYGDQGLHGPQ